MKLLPLTLPLALLLLCSVPSLARPGRRPPLRKPPTYKTEAEHIALVKSGKLPGYFNKADLSKPPVLSAPSALLMEYDTGEVLYESAADTKRYPASTTKILTGLLLAENTKPDDIVMCTDPAVLNVEPSSLHIKLKERFRAEQLLYGFLLRSANDGGVVIADHVSGSVPAFAQKMNERAAQIGATSSHFVNPHGLHDPDHYTTARDLALIARIALQNPRFADAVSIPRRTISRSLNFKDLVVESKAKKSFYDVVPGADGVKTGFTNPARHCYVGSATRNGRRLLAVILAAPSSGVGDAVSLIEWGFARYSAKTVAVEGQRAAWVPTRLGAEGRVAAQVSQTLHVTQDRLYPTKIETRVEVTANTAPIQKGQEVGVLVVLRGGKQIVRVPLQATQAIPRSMVRATSRSPWLWVTLAGGGGATLLILRQRQLAQARRARARRRRRTMPPPMPEEQAAPTRNFTQP
ncbi:MAG: D-alanyl-D-alanine carboxypeptidase [Armatimonadetes bacterium]|nr:D-alanyl-D-alanine carboxypeptidase [Armatimonadota bacterium]